MRVTILSCWDLFRIKISFIGQIHCIYKEFSFWVLCSHVVLAVKNVDINMSRDWRESLLFKVSLLLQVKLQNTNQNKEKDKMLKWLHVFCPLSSQSSWSHTMGHFNKFEGQANPLSSFMAFSESPRVSSVAIPSWARPVSSGLGSTAGLGLVGPWMWDRLEMSGIVT